MNLNKWFFILDPLTTYKQCRLKVSRWAFDRFKFDLNQTNQPELITDFFEEVNRDQHLLDHLIRTNKELKAELVAAKCDEILKPNFLPQMYAHMKSNQQKSKYCSAYSDYMKNVALYIFAIAGRSAYSLMEANMKGALPSLTTLQSFMNKKESFDEARFRFREIREEMIESGEELRVHCSEDDTKITERLRYNLHSDEILGLQLPLDNDGKPLRGSFKFTSLQAAQEYLSDNPMSTYAKLMTIRSLTPNSKVHVLVIYGTRGSDKAIDVHARWRFVQKEFKSIGIEVVCKFAHFFLLTTYLRLSIYSFCI